MQAPSEVPGDRAQPQRIAPLLLLVTLLLALSWLLQTMAALPFLRGPIFDSVVYAAQAEAVREGRFGDPTLLAFSPLYGYWIALFGGARQGALVAGSQLALWALTLVAIYRSALRAGDRAAAFACAGLFALHGPFLFYTAKLLAESLGTALAFAGLLALRAPSAREGRWRSTVGAGALLALATLARASQLFALPFFVLFALPAWGRDDRGSLGLRARRAAGIALGIALVLGFNTAWNARHTGLAVPVILVSRTIDRSTAREWRGRLNDLAPPGSEGTSPWDVVDQARARIAAHQRGERAQPPAQGGSLAIPWASFARGLPRKLQGTLQDREITSFMYSYYGEASESVILRWMPVSFGVLLLLGLLGAAQLARREGASALLPYAPFVIAGFASCLLYHPSARYRLPITYPLVLLAGPALVALVRGARAKDSPAARRALCAVALAMTAVLAARNITYRMQYPPQWHASVARSHALAGEMPEAAARIAMARASGTLSADTERYLRAIPMRGVVSDAMPRE